MSAHRYWRVNYRLSQHGGVRNMATEIELRTTVGGSDQTGSGTASTSSVWSGSAANVFDNDTGTSLTMSDFNNGWIKYDFGASMDQAIVEMSLRVNTANGGPAVVKVEGSDDDSIWVPYHYAHGLSWTNGETKVFTFGPLHPRLRVTSLGNTSIEITGEYVHPAAAQESVQWELEEETGDFSTPLQDSGEVTSGDLTKHTFSSLDPETVYQIRCRMKEADNSNWGNYGYLFIRTPAHGGGSREDFNRSDLTAAPTGWAGSTSAHSVREDEDHRTDNARTNQDYSRGVVLRSHNNAVWSPGAYPLYWSNGPSIDDVRVVAMVENFQHNCEQLIGARYSVAGGDGYLLWANSSGSAIRAPDGTTIDSGGPALSIDTRYWMMLECDGTTIRGKIWAVGTAEPAGFDLSGTNSERTGGGEAWIDGDVVGSGSLPQKDHIQVEYLESQVPVTPTVVVDAISESAADFSTSTFAGGSGVHKDTQWQVATDAAFTTLVEDVASSVDKVAHSINGLASGVKHWVRARFRDDVDAVGEWATGVEFTTGANPGVGLPPELTIQTVGATAIGVGVEQDSLFLDVTYRIQQGTTTVQQQVKSGAGRFDHEFLSLSVSTTYTLSARVTRIGGVSPWSSGLTVDTLATDPDPGDLLGCPPDLFGYLWNPDANPVDWDTRRGYGWYVPYAGQPVRGMVTCILRYPLGGGVWDVEISDDLGVTYTPLISDIPHTGEDGDGLETYQFTLDSTLFADGQDYRLKGTSSGTIVESLSFCIDNAEIMSGWTNREFLLPNDRFAHLWYTRKGKGWWGGEAEGEKMWYQASWERSIINYRGGPMSAFVDTEVPLCLGGDVTIRFYLYDGEGGLFHQQARQDFEGWSAGIGFFVAGESDEILESSDTKGHRAPDGAVGLFVGLKNAQSTAIGCCDDFVVSFGGTNLTAVGRPTPSDIWDAQLQEDDSFQNSGLIKVLERVHGKHAHTLFKYLTGEVKASFVDRYSFWREGHLPGVTPQRAETCGRRYEMVTLRVRAEVDAADHSRLRVRVRCDHAGVEPPTVGYWHYDEWHLSPNDWQEGVLAVVGGQEAHTLYGDANGSRTIVGYSMMPLNPGLPPELPTEPVDVVVQVPQEGEPCALVLQAYEDDRETLKWEVGTDRAHINPYLSNPEHYGEQEIDIIKGGATIATVDVVVIDKAQIPGDQDSGWMSERVTEGGIGIIKGRRFRLIRFIDPVQGWVVVADGPGGVPRMDESYAAYKWAIRDTRETERKTQAFIEADDNHMLPMGVEFGFGQSIDPETGDEFWVVEANEPIIGQMAYLYRSEGVPDEGYIDFGTHWSDNYHFALGLLPETQTLDPRLALTDDVYKAGLSEVTSTDGRRPVFYTWPQLQILWRPEGSSDPYHVVEPSTTLTVDRRTAVPRDSPLLDDPSARRIFYGRNIFRAFAGQTTPDAKSIQQAVRWLVIQGVDEAGNLKTDYTYPALGQMVEVLVRYKGRPTEFAPKHIEFSSLESYLFLPAEEGDYAVTLYDPVMDTAGDTSFRALIAPNQWDLTGIIWSRFSGVGLWYMYLSAGGFLGLAYWRGFPGVTQYAVSTDPVVMSAASKAWVRVDMDVDDGLGNRVITFLTSADGVVWYPLGDPVTHFGAGALPVTTDPIEVGVGFNGVPPMAGRVYELQLMDEGVTKYHARFNTFSTPVSSFPDDVSGLLVTINSQGDGEADPPDPVAEMRVSGTFMTAGELVKDLYDGVYSPRDSVTGELIPSGIRYDESAVLAMTDPVRLRVTETVKDIRKWTEKHIYGPTGWVPALDNDLLISPVSQVPPQDFSTQPIIDDPITEPVPNWNAGETIVNLLNFKYKRMTRVEPEDAAGMDLIALVDIEIEFRDEVSIGMHGEERADWETEAFMANGDPTGSPSVALELEMGWQLSQDRKLYILDRYTNGSQIVHIPVKREFTATLRPGDWVVLDLTWIPDYLLRRRAGTFGGQILAIRDVDCAWRELLIEEALPVAIS